MVCIRGSSTPSFSPQSGQTCKQRSAVDLPSLGEGQNADLEVGGVVLPLSMLHSPSKHLLARFQVFGNKEDHGIKGSTLC